MESRRTATRNLVAAIAALERKPRVMVSQSAVGYYGDRGETSSTSRRGHGGDFASEVVGEWEKAAARSRRRRAAGRSSAPASSSTPRAACSSELLTAVQARRRRPARRRRQYMSWIHIDDEVGSCSGRSTTRRSAASSTRRRPNPVTNREFSKALGRALGRPAVMPVPGFALDRDPRPRGRRAHGEEQHPRHAPAHARPRLLVPAPRARGGAAGPAGR